MLKTKTKLEIGIIAVVILVIAGYAFFSRDSIYKVEAKRIALYGGNLYRASNLFGTEQITFNKDIKIFFGESNDKILFGKGFTSLSGSPLDFASTQLHLANIDGMGEVVVSEKADVVYAMFDKSGKSIIYLVKDGHIKRDLYKYDLETKKRTLLSQDASLPHMSTDGKKLVYVKKPKNFIEGDLFLGFALLDIETGSEKIVPNTNVFGDYAPIFTPDSKKIVFFNEGMHVINIDGTGRKQIAFPGDSTNVYGISDLPIWSLNGKYMIFHGDHEIYLVEFDSQYTKLISAGAISYGTDPQWVEEGKTISVLAPEAKAGDEALSVVGLNGKVLSGDKTHESKYYKNGKSLLRVRPTKVAQ